MPTSAFLLRALYLYMRDENLATTEFLRRTGLTLQDPGPSSHPVDSATLGAAIQAAFEAGAEPALGLRVGATAPLHALGLIGQLIAHSPTLRSAVTATQRFSPLLQTDGEIRLTETGPLAALDYEPALSREPERRFAIELMLSSFVTLARRFVGKTARPQLVLLPYAPPDYQAEYETLFGCQVVFGAKSATLLFERGMLDVPQPFTDQLLRGVLENQLEWQLCREDRSAPLHMRVRAILEQEGSVLPERVYRDLERKLGLSMRAVRRRLTAEGHTLTGLFDEYRRDQALHLVREVDIPLKSIADRLGFSDPSAFHRAFRRWTGTTPMQFRLSQHRRPRADAA